MIDKDKLNILHDHYKESFSLIRDREKTRNRLFITLIAFIGLLFLMVQYSEILLSTIKEVKLSFINLDLSSTPIFIFLSIVWVYLFIVALKYCQVSINIERQYEYLHRLEEKISSFFQDKKIYCREGRAYLEKYPLFSDLVWFFYILVFPIIVIISLSFILKIEWSLNQIPHYHLFSDFIFGLMTSLLFFFYRIFPLLKSLYKKVIKNK